MKKFAMAALAALALLFGGLVTAAPAQADAGTSVAFNGVSQGIPRTIDLYNTNIYGNQYQQPLSTVRHNVERVCPKNSNYRLQYTNPRGTTDILGAGQCFHPGLEGTYRVYLLWA